jgi:hypothetical protein
VFGDNPLRARPVDIEIGIESVGSFATSAVSRFNARNLKTAESIVGIADPPGAQK